MYDIENALRRRALAERLESLTKSAPPSDAGPEGDDATDRPTDHSTDGSTTPVTPSLDPSPYSLEPSPYSTIAGRSQPYPVEPEAGQYQVAETSLPPPLHPRSTTSEQPSVTDSPPVAAPAAWTPSTGPRHRTSAFGERRRAEPPSPQSAPRAAALPADASADQLLPPSPYMTPLRYQQPAPTSRYDVPPQSVEPAPDEPALPEPALGDPALGAPAPVGPAPAESTVSGVAGREPGALPDLGPHDETSALHDETSAPDAAAVGTAAATIADLLRQGSSSLFFRGGAAEEGSPSSATEPASGTAPTAETEPSSATEPTAATEPT